jgi:hypothetical protein
VYGFNVMSLITFSELLACVIMLSRFALSISLASAAHMCSGLSNLRSERLGDLSDLSRVEPNFVAVWKQNTGVHPNRKEEVCESRLKTILLSFFYAKNQKKFSSN